VAENVPPYRIEPLISAPVEKLTEPRDFPFGAVMASKLVNSDPTELMTEPKPQQPEIEIEPNVFVRVIGLAQAAIGNVNASNARTTTRLMLIPSIINVFSQIRLGIRLQGIGRLLLLMHLLFQNDKIVTSIFINNLHPFSWLAVSFWMQNAAH